MYLSDPNPAPMNIISTGAFFIIVILTKRSAWKDLGKFLYSRDLSTSLKVTFKNAFQHIRHRSSENGADKVISRGGDTGVYIKRK